MAKKIFAKIEETSWLLYGLTKTRIYPNLLTSIITWVDSKISSCRSYFSLHPMSSHMHVRTIPRRFCILSRYVNVIQYTTTLVLSEIWDLQPSSACGGDVVLLPSRRMYLPIIGFRYNARQLNDICTTFPQPT